ncbi:MAG: SDR family NAD(P)-dependent oxidoreductase [Pleurocapsa sp.]
MSELNNAVILITGAAGGFGRELTRQLLQAGSRLILTDLDLDTLRDRAFAIQQEIKTGEIITCLASDLAETEACKKLYHRTKALNIPVDILINNAGIGLFGRMDEVPAEKWEKLMQVNLLAPMRLSSLFASEMIDRRRGHIVNISSLAGWITPPGMAHYCSSKFGLRGFSEGLFHELKPYNIKVTAVYPFFSSTPMLQCERYGTLAQTTAGFPEKLITDPTKVMAKTIKAIRDDRLHVFPDRIAYSLYLLKQYFPLLYNAITNTWK